MSYFPQIGGTGLGKTGNYTVNSGANYISTAVSLVDADNKLDTQLGNFVAQKNATNGLCPLDSNSLVPLANLPSSVTGALHYVGTWNASTNTPTIVNGTGTNGYMYYVSVAGSTTIDGKSNWNVGDIIVFDGFTNVWDKIDNYQYVTSVAGKTGAVTVTASDVGLGNVQNVDQTNGSNITSGTVADARLTTNVTLLGNSTTGTGSIVRATSPTLLTPTLGVATATSVNKVTITAPTTSATLTLANSSTLTTVGAYAVTLTASGTTSVILPTSGTLLNNALTSGSIYVGNSSNVATGVVMSGDVTIANTGATTIANNAMSNAKLAQAGANTYKGNATGATANVTDIATNTAFNQSFETSTANIKMNGTVAVGSSSNIARADHVHATDTLASSYSVVNTYSVNTTLTASNSVVLASGTITLTLPAASTVANRIFKIKNTGTGTITLGLNGSDTLDGVATTFAIPNQYASLEIVSNGTNWFIL